MAVQPTISICIPAYNYGRYLATAIASALSQTAAAHEIVVSDNHSTDETAAVLRRFGDAVRVVRPPSHQTLGGSFAFVLGQARGTHVVFLAADDALAPDFLRTVRPHLDGNGMVTTGRFDCDESMHVSGYRGASYVARRMAPPEGFFWFLQGCSYSLSGTVFRKDLLTGAPPLPEDAGPLLDWYFALVVGAVAPVRMLWQPLHYVRFHGLNDSGDDSRWRAHAVRFFDFLMDGAAFPGSARAAVERRARALAVDLLDRPLSAYEPPWRDPVERYCLKWLGDAEMRARSAAAHPRSGSSRRRAAGGAGQRGRRALLGQVMRLLAPAPGFPV